MNLEDSCQTLKSRSTPDGTLTSNEPSGFVIAKQGLSRVIILADIQGWTLQETSKGSGDSPATAYCELSLLAMVMLVGRAFPLATMLVLCPTGSLFLRTTVCPVRAATTCVRNTQFFWSKRTLASF